MCAFNVTSVFICLFELNVLQASHNPAQTQQQPSHQGPAPNHQQQHQQSQQHNSQSTQKKRPAFTSDYNDEVTVNIVP